MRILAINYSLDHWYVDQAGSIASDKAFADYDVIVADPWPVETILGIDKVESGTLEDEQTLTDYVSQRIDERFSEASAFLQAGGTIVSILRPLADWRRNKTLAGRPTLNNYMWFLRSGSPSGLLPIKPGVGHQLEYIEKNSPFCSYLEINGIAWEAYWTGPSSRSLAWDTAGRVVALVYQAGKGQIVLLPSCSSLDRGRVLIDCLRSWWASLTESDEEEAPGWVQDISPLIEEQLEEERERIGAEIQRLREERAEKLTQIQRVRKLSYLLWGTGSVLEEAVREAFSWLDFRVEKKERVDLVITYPLGTAFVEVVGSENVITVGKLNQLGGYIIDWGPPSVKGILIGNAFRLQALKDRPPHCDWFSRETVESAMSRGYALLTTDDLYYAVDWVLQQSNSDASLSLQQAIFDARGLCNLMAILQNTGGVPRVV